MKTGVFPNKLRLASHFQFYYILVPKVLRMPLQNEQLEIQTSMNTRNTNIHEHNARKQTHFHIYRTQHLFERHCLRNDLRNNQIAQMNYLKRNIHSYLQITSNIKLYRTIN